MNETEKRTEERAERRKWLLDDVSMKSNSLARSVVDAREGHCDGLQILHRINARLELEGFVVLPKPPKAAANHDPVSQLIIDVQSAADALSRAVALARTGTKGISYEDWYLRKVITESLAKVDMQAEPTR